MEEPVRHPSGKDAVNSVRSSGPLAAKMRPDVPAVSSNLSLVVLTTASKLKRQRSPLHKQIFRLMRWLIVIRPVAGPLVLCFDEGEEEEEEEEEARAFLAVEEVEDGCAA